MATIRITQYLRPNGRKAEVFADIPDELKGKADLLEISAEALPNVSIKEELDALFECRREVVIDWIKEIMDDYICPDCEHKGR